MAQLGMADKPQAAALDEVQRVLKADVGAVSRRFIDEERLAHALFPGGQIDIFLGYQIAEDAPFL